MTRARRNAIIVVDPQRGFIDRQDELPVPDGAAVIPVINRILPLFHVRIASQDWHPPDHGSFASNNPGRKPFDRGELGGVEQVFWPDHCVQGTPGADFHPDLDQHPIQAIFRKGADPGIDSYSVFNDNASRNPTGAQGYLAGLGVTDLYLAGLALDYCVLYSARDARRLMPEAGVAVVLDACRPVDHGTGRAALEELRALGVRVVSSADLGR